MIYRKYIGRERVRGRCLLGGRKEVTWGRYEEVRTTTKKKKKEEDDLKQRRAKQGACSNVRKDEEEEDKDEDEDFRGTLTGRRNRGSGIDGIWITIVILLLLLLEVVEGTVVVVLGTDSKGEEAKAREKVDVTELGRSVPETRIEDRRVRSRVHLLSPPLLHLRLHPLTLWPWWDVHLHWTWVVLPWVSVFLAACVDGNQLVRGDFGLAHWARRLRSSTLDPLVDARPAVEMPAQRDDRLIGCVETDVAAKRDLIRRSVRRGR